MRCKRDEPLTVETFDAARTLLASKEWLECVRKGGPRKAHWLCPACLPKPATGQGLSTGHFVPTKVPRN